MDRDRAVDLVVAGTPVGGSVPEEALLPGGDVSEVATLRDGHLRVSGGGVRVRFPISGRVAVGLSVVVLATCGEQFLEPHHLQRRRVLQPLLRLFPEVLTTFHIILHFVSIITIAINIIRQLSVCVPQRIEKHLILSQRSVHGLRIDELVLARVSHRVRVVFTPPPGRMSLFALLLQQVVSRLLHVLFIVNRNQVLLRGC